MLPMMGPDFMRLELDEIRRRNEGMRHAVQVRQARDQRDANRWRDGVRLWIGRKS